MIDPIVEKIYKSHTFTDYGYILGYKPNFLYRCNICKTFAFEIKAQNKTSYLYYDDLHFNKTNTVVGKYTIGMSCNERILLNILS